jgi:hypothetical protein
VKDKNIISTLCFNPNFTKSSSSFSVTVGKSINAPGRDIFFFSPKEESFYTVTITLVSLTSSTIVTILPSAIKIYDPGLTDFGRDL